jgi:hypothetical protein
MNNKYPKDLAKKIFGKLNGEKGVSEKTLNQLFEAMYHASFKTEEGEPINFSIIYGDIEDFNDSDALVHILTAHIQMTDD